MIELLIGIAVVVVAVSYVLRPILRPGAAVISGDDEGEAGESGAERGDASRGKRCPTCGPRPEAEAVYCSNCGRRLGSVESCRHCGARLAVGALYCAECGTGVSA